MITTVLAVYAAIVSTLTITLTVFRDLRDRGKLKVSVNVRRIVCGTDGTYYAVAPSLPVEGMSEDQFVVMTVINTGRRPMLWKSWGGDYMVPQQRKSWVTIPRDLPKLLGENETHNEFAELDGFLPDNIKSIHAIDGKGKTWRLTTKELTVLKGELRIALAAGSRNREVD